MISWQTDDVVALSIYENDNAERFTKEPSDRGRVGITEDHKDRGCFSPLQTSEAALGTKGYWQKVEKSDIHLQNKPVKTPIWPEFQLSTTSNVMNFGIKTVDKRER